MCLVYIGHDLYNSISKDINSRSGAVLIILNSFRSLTFHNLASDWMNYSFITHVRSYETNTIDVQSYESNSIHVRNYETNLIYVRKLYSDPHLNGKIIMTIKIE